MLAILYAPCIQASNASAALGPLFEKGMEVIPKTEVCVSSIEKRIRLFVCLFLLHGGEAWHWQYHITILTAGGSINAQPPSLQHQH
jgi:hypothetical protein